MTDQERQLRKEALVVSMLDRLRPVCASWPEEDFLEMVHRLAEITLKYEGQATVGTYDRRTTDRLLADLKEALERNARSRSDNPER